MAGLVVAAVDCFCSADLVMEIVCGIEYESEWIADCGCGGRRFVYHIITPCCGTRY